MRFPYVLAAGTLALGVAVGAAAPASATTVTDVVTFSDSGTYGVGGAPWNGSAAVTGSFDIKFDPTLVYAPELINGIISGLQYTVTDSRFGPGNISLNPIVSFQYAYGTLELFSAATPGKDLSTTSNIVISINGWGDTPAADVWYSQAGFEDTLTTSGSASIVDPNPAPLPSTWTMLIAGFVGLGFLAYRGTKKGSTAFAAA